MDHLLIAVFGVKDHLTTAQEGARAVLIFAYGFVLLRLIGPRVFGRWSAVDYVITIMVGSALARAMTGSAPLVGTMVAAAVMAVLHLALAYSVAHSPALARLLEGKEVTLIQDGKIDHQARKRELISGADLKEGLRQHGIDGEPHVDNVKKLVLEPSGKFSVIKVDPCRKSPA